jgi:hypothetical protein
MRGWGKYLIFPTLRAKPKVGRATLFKESGTQDYKIMVSTARSINVIVK